MKKRLSLLMVLMMVVSLLPMSAFAAVDGGIHFRNTSVSEVERKDNASQNNAIVKIRIEVEPGSQLGTSRGNNFITLTQNEGGRFLVTPAGTSTTTGSTVTVDPGTEKVSTVQVPVPYISNTGSSSQYVYAEFTVDYDNTSEGNLTINITGSEDSRVGTVEAITILKVAYADNNLNIVVKDNEAVTSFDGGKLSPFEVRKFVDNGSTPLYIELDKDDYYAFNNATKVFVDGKLLAQGSDYQITEQGFLLTVYGSELYNAKVVRVEPSLEKMGTRASTGDVYVVVKSGGTRNNPNNEATASIGQVVDFGVTMTIVEKNKKEIPTVWGGETAKVTVTLKGPKGSFDARPIEFELDDDEIDVIKASLVKNGTNNGVLNNHKATPGMTVYGAGVANKNDSTIFQDAKFEVYAQANQTYNFSDMTELTFDLELRTKHNFSGTAKLVANQRGWEVESDAITVVPKLTMETAVTDIKKGGEPVQTKNVVLTEGKAGLLRKGDQIFIALDTNNDYVLFNSASGITVEATNGMTLKDIKIANESSQGSSERYQFADGKWERFTTRSFVGGTGRIGVLATVDKPSKGEAAVITIAGQKVIVDGSQPDKVVQVRAGLNGYYVTPKADYVNVVKEYGSKATETVFTIGQTTYTVTTGGETVEKTAHTAPYIKEGRTMLPIRAVAESLGLEVQWNQATQTASFTDANKVAAVTIGAKTMYVNGTPMPLTVPAELTNDTTFVELRSLATAFGVQIDWDAAAKQAIVSNK